MKKVNHIMIMKIYIIPYFSRVDMPLIFFLVGLSSFEYLLCVFTFLRESLSASTSISAPEGCLQMELTSSKMLGNDHPSV